MSAPWPFVAWGMDVIGPIDPPASNGHCFILVSIDYFTKWVDATSHKSVTKKVVADFIKNNLICHFSVSESIITDNGANLNSHLMKDISEQFKITHKNSTTYRPQMNGAIEAANKNIKRILGKMVDNYKNWHEQLPYALTADAPPISLSTAKQRQEPKQRREIKTITAEMDNRDASDQKGRKKANDRCISGQKGHNE
ncbi:uncharacterized protein LOC132628674 [Lycium barbarum]|uniref:uncharacterized protein LOC132628674 n=1 Tax=Lycium barbarum TaxID=112863 RepID=UPI00293F580C|nr:uncharacterized protein LOC132628674 [Lycium barbarum]